MARTRRTRRRRARRSRPAGEQNQVVFHQAGTFEENDSKLIQTEIINFFQDKDNPYIQSSLEIKSLFSEEQGNLRVKDLPIVLESYKPQNFNEGSKQYIEMCIKDVKEESGYLCFTCFPESRSRICPQCFDASKHIGHYYRLQDHEYQHGYCQCGRNINKDIFSCQKHNLQIKMLPDISIGKKHQEELRNNIASIFKILFYLRYRLKHRNYKEICKKLQEQLTSIFNSQLINNMHLLSIFLDIMQIKIEGVSILQHILCYKIPQILVTMCSNQTFCKRLALLWAKPQQSATNEVCKRMKFSGISQQILILLIRTNGLLKFLAEHEIYPSCEYTKDEYLQVGPLYLMKGNKTLLQCYFENRAKKMKQSEFFDQVISQKKSRFNHLFDHGTYEFLVKWIFQFLIKETKTKKQEKEKKKNRKKGKVQQNIQEKAEMRSNQQKESEIQLMQSGSEKIEELEVQKNLQDEEGKEEEDEQNGEDKYEGDEEDQDEQEEESEQSDQQQQSNKSQQKKPQQSLSSVLELQISSKIQTYSKSSNINYKQYFNTDNFTNNTSYINEYLLYLVNGDLIQTNKLGDKFIAMGFHQDVFPAYLSALAFQNYQNNYISFATQILYLFNIRQAPNRQEIIKKFMKHKVLAYEDDFKNNVNSFVNLVNQIVSAQLEASRYCNTTDDKKNGEKYEQMFRQYLYTVKKVSMQDLSSFKYQENPMVCQKKSTAILKELCILSNQNEDEDYNQQYIYTSNKEYPSTLFKLKIPHHELFTVDHLKYGDKVDLSQYPHIEQLLKLLLSSKTVFKQLETMYRKYMKTQDENEIQECKSNHYLLTYYYLLVLAHHFGNPVDTGVNALLQQIRTDKTVQKECFKFCSKQNFESLLSIDLSKVDEKVQKINVDAEEKKQEQLKAKAQKKRQKFNKKFKDNNTKILALQTTKSMQEEEYNEDEDTCLLCHQSTKPDNQLAYAGLVQKNQILSTCLFGDADASKIAVSSCFHCIHIYCFPKIDKSDGYFSCLLCQKKCNALIPKTFSLVNKKVLKICSNILIANFVNNFKELEVQSLPVIMFKHLVTSRGLNLFAYGSRTQMSSSKNKINDFIEACLIRYLEECTEPAKNEFLEDVDALIAQIQKCEREDLREIQLIVVKAVKSKIIDKKLFIDIDRMKKIRKSINYEDFLIIKNQLEEFGKEQVKLPSDDKNNKDEEVESASKKKSLIFQPLIPPQSSVQLPFFGGTHCKKCLKKKRYSICLICGDTFCQQCYGSSQHKNQHRERVFNFCQNSGEINLEYQNNYECEYVYRSDFGMNLSDITFDNSSGRDVYYLRQKKVDNLVKKFFGQS